MKISYKKGFTLMELLVVISIISVLSSTVLASVNQVRGKARVARAVSDLRQIETALILYADTHNRIPCGNGPWFGEEFYVWADSYERNAFSNFIKWPKNPWGHEYSWELDSPESLTVAIRLPGNDASNLDDIIDDGNLTTGNLHGSEDVLNYNPPQLPRVPVRQINGLPCVSVFI